MTIQIVLKQVSRWHTSGAGQVPALQDIDLEIAQGEHLAIVGKSGSGKTTLLNMLTGIDRPSRGQIHINDTPVHVLEESELATWRGRNIGIVFQFFQLIPTLTVLENILLAMDLVGKVPQEDRESKAVALLRQVGIAGHADKLPAALSGGEQQRAAIARAMANDPPILVADEPTGNLDSQNAAAIHHLFTELSASGKTVLVVTHEQDLAARYDRIIHLKDGRIDEAHPVGESARKVS